MLKGLYHWMEKQVHHPYATSILGALFFIEAIFFVPVDPILMLYCIERQHRALYYATIATGASVLGGIGGYLIGYSIWETIGSWLVNTIVGQETFDLGITYFKEYEIWTVLIAGFTPLPYKAVTLAAGFCKLPITPFVVCSLVSRGARFYLIAGVMYIWGSQIKEYIDRYFNLLVVLFVVLCCGAYYLLKH